MGTVKASTQGLIKIAKAIASKGWKKSSNRPLLEASKFLEPDREWEVEPFAYGCSRQTWERFLRGTPIRDRSFRAFCWVLDLDVDEVSQIRSFKENWGAAPDVPNFHGRQQEIATLEQWIVRDKYRLISIVGFAGIGKTSLVRGGIGKTDLSLEIVRQIRQEFDCLIWRRLLNAPSPQVLIGDLIEFISEDRQTNLPTTIDGLVTELLKHLNQHRCLIILDNVESILQSSEKGGSYRPGYEGYGILFERLGKNEHSSCVLLTSRVKPKVIQEMEGIYKVRSLELKGLDTVAGRAIFADLARTYSVNFEGTKSEWSSLIAFYSGNPLALEVAAKHIIRRFNGNLAGFLNHNLMVFGRMRDLLDWHFERLTSAEKTVMYWLVFNPEATSIAELKEDLLSPIDRKHLPETLDSLERQIPIEKTDTGFSLQPVLIEYMTDRAIAQVCQELKSGRLQLFNSHALIKASAKDYVRDNQIRLILQPIIAQTTSLLKLKRRSPILSSLEDHRQRPGYSAGNLINLMRYANLDLSGYDFSGMTIWQANLQGVNLHGVNFTGCEFAKSSLTQDFGGVHGLAIDPHRDLLAMGDSIGGIRLFHLENKQPYLYLKGHGKDLWVTAVAFSPNGKLLASSSMDNTVKVWDTDTGQCLKTFVGKEKWIWTVAYSADGQIASGGDDNTISLWNIDTGQCRTLEGHDAWIWSIKFHPSRNLLASAAYDRTVRLWDTVTGKCCNILRGHQNIVLAVDFHADGEILASSSADNTIKLWSVQTGKCLHTLTGHTKEVYSLSFSGGGQTLASGSFDCTAKLWSVQTGQCLKTLKGHEYGVRTLAFATHKNLLATGDINQKLKLWSVQTGQCLKTWQGYTNLIWAIAISADGRSLASGSLDKTVRLWDLQTGLPITTLTGHDDWIWSVAFSPNGQIVASSSDDETIKLWDLKTGQCQNTLRGHTKGGVWTVAFSPNGQLLVSGGRDGTVRFWDTATGKNLRCIEAHSNWIWAVTFSADGKYLVSSSNDKTIKLWDVATGERCLVIDNPSSKVMSVAFHPNGRMLISGGDDRQIELWDLATGKLKQTFTGHINSVLGLLFNDDRTIISSSTDATIRFWNLDTGRCIKVLRGHDSAIRAIALTPDKQTLASGSTDGSIRLWDLKTGQTQKLLRPKRPYEGMNITDVRGLTAAQKEALIALGAVKD